MFIRFNALYNHFFINNSLVLIKYFDVLILSKGVKKELFSFLADWIIDSEPDYPSFADCKLWIKKQHKAHFYEIFLNPVEAIKIRITVVDSGKAASFVDLTHINALRRVVIVIGNK